MLHTYRLSCKGKKKKKKKGVLYKILVFQNKYGFNENCFTLRYVFKREITNRLLVNQELKKPDKRLP